MREARGNATTTVFETQLNAKPLLEAELNVETIAKVVSATYAGRRSVDPNDTYHIRHHGLAGPLAR